MAVSRVTKQLVVMYKLLSPRGWKYAFWRGSGVFVKNRTSFVIAEQMQEFPVRKSGVDDVVAGACLKVHGVTDQWWLERDGFLIAEGKINPSFTKLYDDSNFIGEDREKAEAFADELDGYATMSDAASIGLKCREIKRSGKDVIVPVASASSIGTTLTFMLRPGTASFWNNGLKEETIYKIEKIVGDNLSVVPYDSTFTTVVVEDRLSFSVEQMTEILSSGRLISIEFKTQSDSSDYEYCRLISDDSDQGDSSFQDFNLGVGQQAAVSWAMKKGFNFTPFLDNKLSPVEIKAFMEMLENGADVLGLVGLGLSAEHLQFLAELSEKKIPFDCFLDANVSVDSLRRKAAGMSETIEGWIQDMTPSQKKVARREAFRQRDYKRFDCEGTVQRLLLMADLDGKYGVLAKYLLQKGIDFPAYTKLIWMDLTEDEKDTILEYFRCPGAEIAGMPFDNFLQEKRESIINLYFWEQWGYVLGTSKGYIKVDRNSVLVTDFAHRVLWRGVYVNEKYYYFAVPNLAGEL